MENKEYREDLLRHMYLEDISHFYEMYKDTLNLRKFPFYDTRKSPMKGEKHKKLAEESATSSSKTSKHFGSSSSQNNDLTTQEEEEEMHSDDDNNCIDSDEETHLSPIEFHVMQVFRAHFVTPDDKYLKQYEKNKINLELKKLYESDSREEATEMVLYKIVFHLYFVLNGNVVRIFCFF